MSKNGLKHLNQKERAALRAFVACLQSEYSNQLTRVVLLGSKARGDFGAESDLDVLVLVKSDDWHLHDRIVTESSPVSLKYGALISPKVVGPTLYQKMRRLRSHLLENVRKEGVILWTKQPARRSSRISPTAATS